MELFPTITLLAMNIIFGVDAFQKDCEFLAKQ